MADDEQRIRQLAYRIWESEGRPDGQEQRHWEMARKIVAAERESGRDARPEVDARPEEVEIAPEDSDHSGSRRTEDSVSTPNATAASTPGGSATARSRTGAAKAGAKTAKAAKTESSATKARAGSKTTNEKSTRSRSTTTGKHEKTEEKTEEKTKASDTPRKPRK